MQIHTYLFFGGNCREALAFYEQQLGGKITVMLSWGEGPMKDNVSPERIDQIMHGSIDLGGHILMGADEDASHNGISGTRVVINIDEPGEAGRVFAVLSEGGRVDMAMEETFFAQLFGMVTDRFGVPWMVICDKEN